MSKDALIKARVSKVVKAAVAKAAEERGESEGVIVREALNAYLFSERASTSEKIVAPGNAVTTPYKISRKLRKSAA